MENIQIEQYIADINKYRAAATKYDDESPGSLVQKVKYLTQAYALMGRVSAYLDGNHKRIYVQRKRVYAEAKRDAKRGDKENTAELAVLDLREQEVEAYERMMLWRNEYKSLAEYLYEMRLRVRIDMNMLNHQAN